MTSISRPVRALASSMVVLVAACDSKMQVPTQPNDASRLSLQIVSAAQPITGVWSAVVTEATDLNNASFGRPPSEWIGKTVTGSLSIHLAVPGVGDRNPDPNVWEFGPVPGPGPFIEFVTARAVIDGQAFQTSSAGYQTIFFGDVVSIANNSNVQPSFNPQDSFVGVGPAGIGRQIVGFDASFAPGGVSFDGANLTINPDLLQFGRGLIDDLLETGGIVLRQGTITFSLTKVSISPVGALMEDIIDLVGLGTLQADQVAGLVDKINSIALKLETGNARPACNQLASFINQVRAFVESGDIPSAAGQSLTDQSQVIRGGLGC